MIIAMLTAALAQATVAVPAPAVPVPAVVGRSIKDLPNVTLTHFDVKGKNGKAIKKNLDALLADPAAKNTVRLYGWDVGASIMKRTEGTKCTVTNATATMNATVNLPRLAEQAKVDKAALAIWQPYVASLEEEAAANLWFVKDQLPAVEKSVVGIDCAAVAATWQASLDKLKSQQTAFNAQRAAAAAAAAAAKAAADKAAAAAAKKQ